MIAARDERISLFLSPRSGSAFKRRVTRKKKKKRRRQPSRDPPRFASPGFLPGILPTSYGGCARTANVWAEDGNYRRDIFVIRLARVSRVLFRASPELERSATGLRDISRALSRFETRKGHMCSLLLLRFLLRNIGCLKFLTRILNNNRVREDLVSESRNFLSSKPQRRRSECKSSQINNHRHGNLNYKM